MFYSSLSLTGNSAASTRPSSTTSTLRVPYFGNQWDAERVLKLPSTSGSCPRSRRLCRRTGANAKAYSGLLGEGLDPALMHGQRPGFIPTARDIDHRPTGSAEARRPWSWWVVPTTSPRIRWRHTADFPGAGGMQGFLQTFLPRPDTDLAASATSPDFWMRCRPSMLRS